MSLLSTTTTSPVAGRGARVDRRPVAAVGAHRDERRSGHSSATRAAVSSGEALSTTTTRWGAVWAARVSRQRRVSSQPP